MAKSPGLAAFGAVDTSKTQAHKKDAVKPPSKYQEVFGAIKNAATANETVDQQTGLEWDNIEGEVMGVVLTSSLISGTMFTQIDHPVFKFATPQDCLDKLFTETFVETLNKKRHLVPFTGLKQSLNELMISWKRQGRQEMVEMVKALQLSLQESEKNDGLLGAMKR